MERSTRLNDLLKDGYTKKFAEYYLGQAESYKQIGKYDRDYSDWALSKGFLADSAYWYGLNESNYNDFLSDYDYYRLWPLNGWSRIWINDKMTLKHIFKGTEFEGLMPDYYYYTTKEGLAPLWENPIKKRVHTIEDFIEVLKEVGEMACKPCNGTSSLGFFKLSYQNNNIMMDDKEINKETLKGILEEHPNYVYTEYLKPAAPFADMSPKIHTLRVVVINQMNKEPHFMGGYLRIPTPSAGQANYLHLEGERENDYNVVTNFNPNTGEWGDGKLIYLEKYENAACYPGTDKALKGVIENNDTLKQLVLGVCERYRTIEYMGFDLCCSTKGFKCMEINTHPGIRHMQIFDSLLADDSTREYFERKIHDIDVMDESQKIVRNNIMR